MLESFYTNKSLAAFWRKVYC